MLNLYPGPQLTFQPYAWEPTVDVTAEAQRYLNEPLTIHEGVTLMDVLRLTRGSAVLQDVFARDDAHELLVAGEAAPPHVLEADARDRSEYLELYQLWELDSESMGMTGTQRWDLHAVGPVLTEDYPEVHKSAGERVEWGLAGTHLSALLQLPVKCRTSVPVCESAPYVKNSGNTLYTLTQPTILLGQFLHTLFDNLAPKAKQGLVDGYLAAVQVGVAAADAKEETAGAGANEFFAQLFDPTEHAGCVLLFDTIGPFGIFDLRQAMAPMEDDWHIGEAIDERFGDAVVVAEKYRGLTVRQFRQLFAETKFPPEAGIPGG